MSLRITTTLSLVTLCLLLLLASCSMENNSGITTPQEDTQIALSIGFAEGSEFASVAKNAEAVVTADDMETITATLTIGKKTVSGAVKKVPAGKERCVQVNVTDEKGTLCYVGKTVVDVIGGKEVKAPLNLYKVDETGTIIIEGVVIDNNNSDYFTEKELVLLVEKMSKKAGVDPKKVMALLKKPLFAKKWKKSQLPEVEKMILKAIKEVSGGNNGDYFTEKELLTMVNDMSKKATVDPEKVIALLKKEGKFFETKWKKDQVKEVMAIIQEAIKKVSGGNNTDYFTQEELLTLIKEMSKKANVNPDKVIAVLKKDSKFFDTKWKKEQKREVMAMIDRAIKSIGGNNGEYYTVDELNALVKRMSNAANVDPRKVMEVLKKGGKFYETKWKKDQQKEVMALIEEAIKKVNGGNNGDYFTQDELLSLIKDMSKKANVNPDKVIAVLKKDSKFFDTKWKKEQKREVMAMIDKAIKSIGGNNGEFYTIDELNALVKRMSNAANVDPRKVMEVLKKGGKFYETKWKKDQQKEVMALIEEAIKKVNGGNNGDYFTQEELLTLIKDMSKKANVNPDKVIAVLKKDSKFFDTKWKKEQKREVMAMIDRAIKSIGGNNGEYYTIDELNALVQRMSKSANVDPKKVMEVLKKGGKFYETKWKKEDQKEVLALIEEAIKEIS